MHIEILVVLAVPQGTSFLKMVTMKMVMMKSGSLDLDLSAQTRMHL